MKFSILNKHLIQTLLIVTACVLPLSALSFLLVKRLHHERPLAPPPVMYAKILSHLAREERIIALKEMGAQDPDSGDILWIFNGRGQILYPPRAKKLPLLIERGRLPAAPLAFTELGKKEDGAPAPYVVVKLDDAPDQFLLVHHLDSGSGGGFQHSPFFVTFIGLFAAVLIGTTISTLFLFYNLRKKAALADSVLNELQKGNLKARFPVTKMDEIGWAMVRFNRMAEEIERLVDRLKTTERSRMALLQELAHDLRTPVASL